MKKVSIATAVGAAMVLVVACSSSGGSSSSGSITTYVQSVCTWTQKCQPRDFSEQFADVPSCTSEYAQLFNVIAGLPGTSLPSAKLEACASEINALDCSSELDAPPDCDFPGTLAGGAACAFGTQCASSNCVMTSDSDADGGATTTSSLCGKCSAAVGLGQPCGDQPNADCTHGLACGPANTCVAEVAKGGACSPQNDACASGLRCVNQVCGAPIPAGGACDEDEDNCAEDLQCENKVCVDSEANITVVQLGQPCGVDTTNPDAPKESVCQASSCVGAEGAQKCVAFAAAGQPCRDESSASPDETKPDCGLLLTCTNGTCVKADYTQCK